MLEFVFVAIFIFTFFICSIELIRMSYVKLALQYVATNALRTAVIGPSDTVRDNHQPPGDLMQEAAAEIQQKIINDAASLWVGVAPADISICPIDSVCPPNTLGGPLKTLRISITRPVSLFFGGFGKWRSFTLSTLVLGRNEPFEVE